MTTEYEDKKFIRQSLEDIRTILNDALYYHTDNLKNQKTVIRTLKVLRAHTIKLANSLK